MAPQRRRRPQPVMRVWKSLVEIKLPVRFGREVPRRVPAFQTNSLLHRGLMKSLFTDVLTGQLGVPQWIENLCVYTPYVVMCIFGILMWYIGFTNDQPGELKLLP